VLTHQTTYTRSAHTQAYVSMTVKLASLQMQWKHQCNTKLFCMIRMKRPHSFSIATNPGFYLTQYVNSQNNMYLSEENPMFIQNVPAYGVMDGVSHAYFFIKSIHSHQCYLCSIFLSPAT